MDSAFVLSKTLTLDVFNFFQHSCLSKKVSKYLNNGNQLAGRQFSHIDSVTLNENYVEEENEDEAVLIAENIDIMDSPDREEAVAKMDSYIKKNDLYYNKYFQAVHKPSNY